jgi:tellurite resistance protein
VPYNGTDNADYVDGEVLIEKQNNIWNTPYLFNAKEFDEDSEAIIFEKIKSWFDANRKIITIDPKKVLNEFKAKTEG